MGEYIAKSSWTTAWKCVVGYVPLSNAYVVTGN